MSRTILLHYHLFKNAGTSVDQILKRNFAERWVTAEFPPAGGDNSDQVTEWIKDTPDAMVYSTHTALGPIPQIKGVKIITIMMLRDPIARIRSAYRFERKQDAETWGTELARQYDLEGYVRARLARKGDRQCRNFQAHRLASMVPGEGSELERALIGLDQLSVIGLVENFDLGMTRLADLLQDPFPDFTWEAVQANRTTASPETPRDQDLNRLLEEVNADDLAILNAARAKLGVA